MEKRTFLLTTSQSQAKESSRKLIEAAGNPSYPLDPIDVQGDPAVVPENQSNTGKPLEQR